MENELVVNSSDPNYVSPNTSADPRSSVSDDLALAAEFLPEFLIYYDDSNCFEAIKIRTGDVDKFSQFYELLCTVIDMGEQCDSLTDELINDTHKLKRIINRSQPTGRVKYPLYSECIDQVHNKFLPPSTWKEVGSIFKGYPLEIFDKFAFFDRYIEEQNAKLWKDESHGLYYLIWNCSSAYKICCEALLLGISGESIKGDIDNYCALNGNYRPNPEIDLTTDEGVVNLTSADSDAGLLRSHHSSVIALEVL